MRVESNYGKLEVEKKAKTKLFFSIVLQAVLLIVLTAIVIAIITYSFDKILEIKGRKMIIKENVLTEENEDEYMPSTDQNVEALKTAKKNSLLKKAIESLT